VTAFPPTKSAAAPAFVTVVSGAPRSGTSMMMGMLSAGGVSVLTDDVRRPDRDNPRGYYEFEPVKRLSADAAWLGDAYGRAIKVVYRLLYDLPDHHMYRIIFMQRNIEECLASQRTMLIHRGVQGAELSDAELSRIYCLDLQRVETWIRAQANMQLLKISYNDMVRSPAESFTEVERFLGRVLDCKAAVASVDPSLYRHKRPAA
jgi:Sulfotransferase domain